MTFSSLNSYTLDFISLEIKSLSIQYINEHRSVSQSVLLKPRESNPSTSPRPAVSLKFQSVTVNRCSVSKRVQIYNAFYLPTKTFLIKFLVCFKSFKVNYATPVYPCEHRLVSRADANIKRLLLSNQIKTKKILFDF